MKVTIDVIIPVHNAQDTIEETVVSAMNQSIPLHLLTCSNDDDNNEMNCLKANNNNHDKDDEEIQKVQVDNKNRNTESFDGYGRFPLENIEIDVAVCCYDDGSTDESFAILTRLKERYESINDNTGNKSNNSKIDDYGSNSNHISKDATKRSNAIHLKCRLLIQRSSDGVGRGAGYARNRAASLRYEQTQNNNDEQNMKKEARTSSTNDNEDMFNFLCLLDSDDIMHEYRIAEQVSVMLNLSSNDERDLTILGCTFSRIPEDSTWHYTSWVNNLSDERILLERFREVTVIQPTWFLTRKRFEILGGYIEAPHPNNVADFNYNKYIENMNQIGDKDKAYKLIHPKFDTAQSLRLAEDLRFFHAHLAYTHKIGQDVPTNDVSNQSIGDGGVFKMIRTIIPLLKYRHREGQSQSSSTSRKLLLQLRTKAFVDAIIRNNPKWTSGFVIWGAGRDGKDFFKALPDDVKFHVKCFVDVDEKKIKSGYYVTPVTNPSICKIGSKNKHLKIPIVHFSLLARDEEKRNALMKAWIEKLNEHEEDNGKITKGRPSKCVNIDHQTSDKIDCKRIKYESSVTTKRQQQRETQTQTRELHGLSKKDKDGHNLLGILKDLPVVCCVAMYRTNGLLEKNISDVGRLEGTDFWHFS